MLGHSASANFFMALNRRLLSAMLLLLSGVLAASAQNGPFLILVDVQAEQPQGNWVTVEPGHVSQASSRGNFFTEHGWSEPPRNMDGSGFSLEVIATVTTANGHIYWGGTAFRTRDFEWNTAERGVYFGVGPNQSDTRRMTAQLTPRRNLAEGAIAEVWVGASFGPGVFYRYRVTYQPPPPPAGSQLAASLECPDEITISGQPVECHVVISSWRRNRAVEVLLPNAVDADGNHQNGILVQGHGADDPSGWGQPPHSWPLSVFACPPSNSGGGDCSNIGTAPGRVEVRVTVRQQGSQPVRLTLAMNAIEQPGASGVRGTARIGNVWRVGEFLNIENGFIESGPIRLGWPSAKWEIEPVGEGRYVRLRASSSSNTFLHIENGVLEAGRIRMGWHSAMWTLEPVAGSNYFRIRNRWKPNRYIHTENGQVEAGRINEGWLSAQWWGLQ
jgi:hypothetical protein